MAIDQSETWFANIKTLFDNFLQESLTDIREKRTFFSKLVSDAQQHDNTRQDVANQALQNAVETANMVGKQAVRHSDLAIDRQWNIDEQGYTAASILDAMNSPAVKQTMASIIAEILAGMAEVKKAA
jgi:hypothetical protein